MKKGILSVFTFLSFLGLGSAQGILDEVRYGSFGIAEIITALFAPFFLALLGGYEKYLFEQVMIFFIIISIVYMTIRQMPVFRDNKAIILIITLSVSLLCVRFFTYVDLIETVLLPYSILGVTFTAFMPLIIGFFFIHQFPEGFIRKAFWIFFIVVFVAMWDLRYTEVGMISWMYFWSAVISLLFLLFDGTIRRAMIREQLKTVAANNQEEFARQLRRELRDLQKDFTDGVVSEQHFNKTRGNLERQLKNVMKW